MTTIIDAISFKTLSELKPSDVCRRALCKYDEKSKSYTLSVWGEDYVINPYEETVNRVSCRLKTPHEYMYIFIINYLLQVKELNTIKDWISEKDIPDGSTFFRGPHEIPTNLISKSYSGNISAFKDVCDELGGIPIKMADAAYCFWITPKIPVAVLFWDKDDDFESESKILYDRSIIKHLALDIIFALAVSVCARIGKNRE